MNTEMFGAVLAAMVAYRILSPLIDTINPLTFLTKPKKISAVAGNAKSAAGVGRAK